MAITSVTRANVPRVNGRDSIRDGLGNGLKGNRGMSLRAGAVAVGAALAVLGASAGALAQPAAHVAGGCSVGSGEGYGYTYLTSLTVSHTTCTVGKRLVRKKGKVSGWHCTKKVLDRSPDQYDARETCTKSSSRVTYTFTQNT